MTGRVRDQSGAATVVALACTALLFLVAVAAATAVALVVSHRRAQSAADLAALAAAQALQRGADPCAAGGRIAAAQGAELAECDIDGEEVTVVVTIRGPHAPGRDAELRGRARAGPAEE